MVTISCPWCDEDERLRLVDFASPGAELVCSSCGTAMSLEAEPETAERPLAKATRPS